MIEQKGNTSAKKTSSYLKNTPIEENETITLSYLNILKLLTSLIGDYLPRNMFTEQPAQFLLTIKTVRPQMSQ